MTSGATRVGVVGGANVDLVVRCNDLPRPGETILGHDFVRLPGGKGANQAVAAARLGADTSLVGCLGTDENGEWLLRHLQGAGVHTTWVQRSSTPSGLALIPVDKRGENLIIVIPGSNEEISLDLVPLEEFDVVLCQLETPITVVLEAARRSRRFVLNAAPRRDVPRELLDLCDVVIVNESESLALDLTQLAQCVVTLGAEGAQYFEHGTLVAAQQPPRVPVVDTVGAGDVFSAAYAVCCARGDGPAEALRYAVTAGALATRGAGAQGSMPTDEEVRSWM